MSRLTRIATRTDAGAMIVAAIAILVYLNALANGFAFDDEFIILNNQRVHQLSDLRSIWLTPYWPGFGAEAGLYRPLAIFAYAMQWSIGGGGAFLFHAMNVLLHAIASVLGFVVLRRMVPALPALFGALVFAVHPVHVEAVANAVGQAELLAGAAILAACVIHFRRDEPSIPPGPETTEALRPDLGRTVALLALYALALLAKESAIVLPALLVAGDAATGRLRLERASFARYVRALGVTIVLLALVAAAYLALRVAVLGSVAGQDAAPSLPFLRTGQRFFVALQTWPEYLRLLVFPLDLSADYSPDVIVPAAGVTPSVLFGTLLLLGTIVMAARTFLANGSGKIAGFAAAWFLIAILPVSNLIVPIGVVLAERILYVPSFALAIVVAYAVARWIPLPAMSRADVRIGATDARQPFLMTAQGTIPAPAFAVIVVIVLLGTRTVLRNPDWRDTPAYWNALVRDHPESYRAQWGVASHMIVNGQPEQGLQYMEAAAATWPHDPYLLAELGGQYLERGEARRAVEILERARELGHEGGRVPLHLGLASLGIGRYEAALDWAALAVTSADTLSPGETATAHALRAQALEGLGRTAEALSAWQTAIQVSPGRSFTYWMMLARAHGRTGDAMRATAAADTARILAPDAEAVARVDRLTTWIAAACWKDSGEAMTRDRCEDPLEDWTLVTPNRAISVKREGSAP